MNVQPANQPEIFSTYDDMGSEPPELRDYLAALGTCIVSSTITIGVFGATRHFDHLVGKTSGTAITAVAFSLTIILVVSLAAWWILGMKKDESIPAVEIDPEQEAVRAAKYADDTARLKELEMEYLRAMVDHYVETKAQVMMNNLRGWTDNLEDTQQKLHTFLTENLNTLAKSDKGTGSVAYSPEWRKMKDKKIVKDMKYYWHDFVEYSLNKRSLGDVPAEAKAAAQQLWDYDHPEEIRIKVSDECL